MTASERQRLREAQTIIRFALLMAERRDWSTVVSIVANTCSMIGDEPVYGEVRNMLASLAVASPGALAGNRAMQLAAIRRLEETKHLIGETLIATAVH